MQQTIGSLKKYKLLSEISNTQKEKHVYESTY